MKKCLMYKFNHFDLLKIAFILLRVFTLKDLRILDQGKEYKDSYRPRLCENYNPAIIIFSIESISI
jgi:hypothetical protein